MVLIECVCDSKSALWLDGFIPCRYELVAAYEALPLSMTRNHDHGDLKRYSLDHLFVKILERAAYAIQDEEKGQGRLFWEDIYYLRPHRIADGFAERFPRLYKELKLERRRRYRQIMAVYETEHYAARTDYVEKLLAGCPLQVKPEKWYADFLSFQDEVSYLLDAVLESFLVPCWVSKKMLRALGFSVSHFTL